MGDLLSTPSQLNPSSSPTTQQPPTMSSSDSENPVQRSSDPTTDTEILKKDVGESKTPIQESLNPPKSAEIHEELGEESLNLSEENSGEESVHLSGENLGEESLNLSEEDLENSIKAVEQGDEEEEEVPECGFCVFMKGGGCKEVFTEWENCVQESDSNEENMVEKCYQATSALKKCMEAHSDYYAPLLQAEKDLEQEAMRQLEEEKAQGIIQESMNEEKVELQAENNAEQEAMPRLEEEKAKSGDQGDQEAIIQESKNEEKVEALDGSKEHEKI